MIDPLIGNAVALGLALLFLPAAWHKISAHAQFVAALNDYRLLPQPLLRPVAASLPVVEAALAVAWLAGERGGVLAAATAALLAVYAAAMAINLWRGRARISCGCGLGRSAEGDAQLSWWLVARNLLLAGLAGVAALPAAHREFGPFDALTLASATAAAALLYAGGSQLLRNAAASAARRIPRD